jgi:hypothetical protein
MTKTSLGAQRAAEPDRSDSRFGKLAESVNVG